MKQDALILVRGGGDLATGTIHRLWSAGLRVLVLEAEHPRRSGGRSRFVRQSMKAKQPWKVCVLCALKRWRRQKRSGTRMRFLF